MTTKTLQNKTCIVTGATAGIGLATVKALAEMGATVVGVSRNPKKCQVAEARIRKETGNLVVDFMVADLSSQAQICQLAVDFQRRHPRLDMLVNNAGAFFIKRRVSVDGFEMTFALNHLNYFLLTQLLLDTLKASAPARVVNVSSNAHYGSPLDFNNLQLEQNYGGMRAYGRSKFANILFTYELARRLVGSGVTANTLHPGFVRTHIGRDNGVLGQLIQPFIFLRALSPEEGARTGIYLATSPEVANVSGEFFFRNKAVCSDPATYDQDAAQRLWEISEEVTGL